jgi:hypothetical protein
MALKDCNELDFNFESFKIFSVIINGFAILIIACFSSFNESNLIMKKEAQCKFFLYFLSF